MWWESGGDLLVYDNEKRTDLFSDPFSVHTPAGDFVQCVKVEETTPLEPQSKEYKYYAPQVGLIQDGTLKLVQRGQMKE